METHEQDAEFPLQIRCVLQPSSLLSVEVLLYAGHREKQDSKSPPNSPIG